MSSSQQPSNNSNNNNSSQQNQYGDYEADESLPQQQQQPQTGHSFDSRNPSYENDLIQEMYHFQEEVEEDLPNEIVAELDAGDRIQSNINPVDESVFSDVVQDAFKKYQNEYAKYWTHNDTIWDNRFSDEELLDDEQEELYAQMEECWNYMTQEDNSADPPRSSVDQSQASALNPDAVEFKPSWLEMPTKFSSSQFDGQQK